MLGGRKRRLYKYHLLRARHRRMEHRSSIYDAVNTHALGVLCSIPNWCLPDTSKLRICFAVLGLHFADPLRHSFVRKSDMFFLPRLVIEVWLSCSVIPVLAVFPHRILKNFSLRSEVLGSREIELL